MSPGWYSPTPLQCCCYRARSRLTFLLALQLYRYSLGPHITLPSSSQLAGIYRAKSMLALLLPTSIQLLIGPAHHTAVFPEGTAGLDRHPWSLLPPSCYQLLPSRQTPLLNRFCGQHTLTKWQCQLWQTACKAYLGLPTTATQQPIKKEPPTML